MVAPFIRAVESFESLKEHGTSVEFFTGADYAVLPENYADTIKDFSLKHLASEEISKAGSEVADTLSPFVLRLRDDEALELLNLFYGLLENEISECVQFAADEITGAKAETKAQLVKGSRTAPSDVNSAAAETTGGNTLLDRRLDEHFDDLRSACDLRDFLLHLASFVKRQSKTGNKGAALVIEV